MYNKLLYGTIGKEAIRRLSHRLSSKPLAAPFLQTRTVAVRPRHEPILRNEFPLTKSTFNTDFIRDTRGFSTHLSAWTREGWLVSLNLPSVVKAGDPVLHQPAREVFPGEIGSERTQKVIDDLVKVMREENLISLAAPQIGVPLQIIALDEFPIAHPPKEDYEAEDKRPLDLLVIVNPKLKQKSSKKGFLFENCVSVPGYTAAVERFLEVEVTGMNRYGQPINVDASGWHARVLQHECDHLVGTLYLDKMVKQTLICGQLGSEERIQKTIDDMVKGHKEKRFKLRSKDKGKSVKE